MKYISTQHRWSQKVISIRDDVAFLRHYFSLKGTHGKNTPIIAWPHTPTDTNSHTLKKTATCRHMHTDVDRQLYLYQRSNKSICSLVYFLWLCPCNMQCLHRLKSGGEERFRRQEESSALWHFGQPLHVVNTTSGPSAAHHCVTNSWKI